MTRFAGHEHAAAYYDTFDHHRYLVSYSTIIMGVSRDGWRYINGLYSATTRKHIGWFMRERGFTYQLAKQLYKDNKEFNVYTGECRDHK